MDALPTVKRKKKSILSGKNHESTANQPFLMMVLHQILLLFHRLVQQK